MKFVHIRPVLQDFFMAGPGFPAPLLTYRLFCIRFFGFSL
jgi:hypothetical protein